MPKISRYAQLIILLFLFPFCSYSFSDDFRVEFQSNLIHVNINIPENHSISANGPNSLRINLEDSANLQKYDVILPKPISRYGSNKPSKFYEDELDFKIALEPWDDDNPVHVRGNITYEICNVDCRKVSHDINIEDCYICDSYIWNILLFALLGGFILNFMPCVLPVLSLKVLSVLNSKKNQKNHLFFSILGIVVVFWVLAFATIILKGLGISFGIGMHFQEPIFIIFLTSLMSIFVGNIMKESGNILPDGLANLTHHNPYMNSFFTGMLAAIFSTPCTAPFLGTAIAFAAVGTAFEIFAIFSFIGLGFSLPYIALMIWPSLLKFLPKPGKWMNNLKLFLAILMIGTIFWLLTILQAQLGFRATFGVLLMLMLIKFISEKKMQLFWKVILYIIILYGLVSLPQMASNEDYQKEEEIKELWQEFTSKRLKESIDDGKIVVVDITADWCGTCKYNKYMVWNRDATIQLLTHPNIVALRKDITIRSIETQRFMQSIGVYGIPFNVVFGPKAPKGINLPTVLSYNDIKRALERAGL